MTEESPVLFEEARLKARQKTSLEMAKQVQPFPLSVDARNTTGTAALIRADLSIQGMPVLLPKEGRSHRFLHYSRTCNAIWELRVGLLVHLFKVQFLKLLRTKIKPQLYVVCLAFLWPPLINSLQERPCSAPELHQPDKQGAHPGSCSHSPAAASRPHRGSCAPKQLNQTKGTEQCFPCPRPLLPKPAHRTHLLGFKTYSALCLQPTAQVPSLFPQRSQQ